MSATRRIRRSNASKKTVVHESSGNVFEDLALPDAAERLAKAQLSRVIRKIIEARGWTQRRAAEQLGVAPSDMSDLMRGKLARFSQERLTRFLNKLDMHVHIQVRPRSKRGTRAAITVEFLSAS